MGKVTGGASWTKATFLPFEPSSHPEIVYAGNRSGGVLRSLDGGATWAQASSGLPPLNEVLAVAVDPIIPARVYAWVRAAGLFVSADGGGS